MRIENLVVNCTARYPRTCRRTPFEVVVYELNYSSEDKELMDLLRTKAEELARQVNPGAANNSMHERSPERILADCIAGVVSEYFWKLYLNSEENVVSETEFDDASRQIDLKVISNNKKIEVRSSFPRNGIEFGSSRNHGAWIFEKVLNLRYENRRCNMDVPSRGDGRTIRDSTF